MERIQIFAALMLVAAASHAAQRIEQHVVRLGSKTIGMGDTEKKVRDAGGEPDRKIDLTNKYGVKIGDEWIFVNGRETIYININGNGQVYNVASSVGE